jgi:hypothetical protein
MGPLRQKTLQPSCSTSCAAKNKDDFLVIQHDLRLAYLRSIKKHPAERVVSDAPCVGKTVAYDAANAACQGWPLQHLTFPSAVRPVPVTLYQPSACPATAAVALSDLCLPRRPCDAARGTSDSHSALSDSPSSSGG